MRLRAALLAAGILAAALVTRAEGQGITNTRALAFGEVSAGVTPGTAVVSPAGVRSFTGGAMAGNPGGVTSASFTVTGIPLLTYGITLPGSVVLSSGGNTMTVDTFTSNPSGTGQIQVVIASQVLTVGATLQVGTSQGSGSYTGTFNVTVVYN